MMLRYNVFYFFRDALRKEGGLQPTKFPALRVCFGDSVQIAHESLKERNSHSGGEAYFDSGPGVKTLM